jgi:DNA-binding NtrC family response regulator
MPLQRDKRALAGDGYVRFRRPVRLAPMGTSGGHAATRVLVVDDDWSIRLLCRVNLELEGHKVLEAHSLAGAREALAEEDVDVVVLDVHLQRERSDALVAECHDRRPPIPVLLVTGSVELTDPRLREADAILPKPFELDQLLSTVRNLAKVHAHR